MGSNDISQTSERKKGRRVWGDGQVIPGSVVLYEARRRRRIAAPAMPIRPVPTNHKLAGSGVVVVVGVGVPTSQSASKLKLPTPFLPAVEKSLAPVPNFIEQPFNTS